MAYYAALVSLMELIEDVIKHHYQNFLLGSQPVMKSLHEKFGDLVQLLEGYSSKGDEATVSVERRIRDVAHTAENLIEFELLHLIDSEEKAHVFKRNFNRLISGWRKTPLSPQERLDEVNKKLLEVEEEVDSITEEVGMIKKSQRIEKIQFNTCCPDDAGPSEIQVIPEESNMVGSEEYLIAMKDHLLGDSSMLQVIAVVGAAGIGKTTLARQTYEDVFVMHHFYCRIWVTVSQDYNLRKVLISIMKSVKMTVALGEDDYKIMELIYKYLKGRRYLIVMDDVWSTDVWDDVKRLFPDDCYGSRIILTTRLSDVAEYAGTCGLLHHMQFLNEDESWRLLQKKVFGQEPCPNELLGIGKFIASKCGGLPLAIVVIAGLLSHVRMLNDWKNIADNLSSILSKYDKQLSNIMLLSYHNLPHRLKPCFLYLGLFPEDYEIPVWKLIRLWIGEGFLGSIGSKSLEQEAEECLDNLIRRSLVLVTKKRSNGQYKACIMHDLLRDFCRQRAFDEGFFHVEDEDGYHLCPKGVENRRYINLYTSSPLDENSVTNIGSTARSIFFFGDSTAFAWLVSGMERNGLRLLRVLDAPRLTCWAFPDGIVEMFHLKYLALSITSWFEISECLPSSIDKLQKLETLIIYTPKSNYISLPHQIWKMSQLRYLRIGRMTLPPVNMVSDILQSLQVVHIVENFTFTNEAVVMLPSLKKLKIRYTIGKSSGNWELYCLNNLFHLSQLEELKIIFDISILFYHGDPLPSGFALPLSLTKLSLQGCRLPWKDMTVVGSLPNLGILRLRENSFVGEEWEPNDEEFLSLKFLLMEELDLKYWRAESSHFPSLECLKITGCQKLKKIPPSIGDIATLKFIHVYRSRFAGKSIAIIREEQQELGNDGLQLLVRN